MTSSRRLATLPLMLIALAVLCTLLLAPEVQAQTATVLVKNTDQTTYSPLALTTTRAQGFTTGTAPGGYNLTSIGVLFDQIGVVSEAPNVITATINEVNGTEPGTVFCTLGSPIRLCRRLRQHLRRIRLLHSLPKHPVLRSPEPHRHLRRRHHTIKTDGQRQRGRYPRHRLVHSRQSPILPNKHKQLDHRRRYPPDRDQGRSGPRPAEAGDRL